ncbi:MAG: hypothetical protein V3U49_01265 [Nitrososphaerales archaeon]
MVTVIDIVNLWGIILASSLIAIATILLWRATHNMAEYSIRPRMVIRPSYQRERLELIRRRALNPNQLSVTGIRIENVGMGSAVNGDIWLKHGNEKIHIKEENENHSWLRIPVNWQYFYPSQDSPKLAEYLPSDEVELEIKYQDINGGIHELPESERRIRLAEPPEDIRDLIAATR